MTQDEQKRAVAATALQYIPIGSIVGVGTGSTANYFIDELAKCWGVFVQQDFFFPFDRLSLLLKNYETNFKTQ